MWFTLFMLSLRKRRSRAWSSSKSSEDTVLLFIISPPPFNPSLFLPIYLCFLSSHLCCTSSASFNLTFFTIVSSFKLRLFLLFFSLLLSQHRELSCLLLAMTNSLALHLVSLFLPILKISNVINEKYWIWNKQQIEHEILTPILALQISSTYHMLLHTVR